MQYGKMARVSLKLYIIKIKKKNRKKLESQLGNSADTLIELIFHTENKIND